MVPKQSGFLDHPVYIEWCKYPFDVRITAACEDFVLIIYNFLCDFCQIVAHHHECINNGICWVMSHHFQELGRLQRSNGHTQRHTSPTCPNVLQTHSLLQIQRLQWSCGCAHKKTHSRCHYYYSRPECETKKKRFKFFFWKNWGIWRLIGGLAVDCCTLADLQRPNARSPTPIDVQRVDGTTRSEVDAESSWRRAVLPTDTVKSDKYYSYHAGLSYWTHLKLVQAVAAQKRTHYMISLKFLAENIDAFAIKWML